MISKFYLFNFKVKKGSSTGHFSHCCGVMPYGRQEGLALAHSVTRTQSSRVGLPGRRSQGSWSQCIPSQEAQAVVAVWKRHVSRGLVCLNTCPPVPGAAWGGSRTFRNYILAGGSVSLGRTLKVYILGLLLICSLQTLKNTISQFPVLVTCFHVSLSLWILLFWNHKPK